MDWAEKKEGFFMTADKNKTKDPSANNGEMDGRKTRINSIILSVIVLSAFCMEQIQRYCLI